MPFALRRSIHGAGLPRPEAKTGTFSSITTSICSSDMPPPVRRCGGAAGGRARRFFPLDAEVFGDLAEHRPRGLGGMSSRGSRGHLAAGGAAHVVRGQEQVDAERPVGHASGACGFLRAGVRRAKPAPPRTPRPPAFETAAASRSGSDRAGEPTGDRAHAGQDDGIFDPEHVAKSSAQNRPCHSAPPDECAEVYRAR